ncbi:protein windpipe [Tribolium madens]|uniref:protein windpipe n=1 Tax=Tribolium madens TaxID=41895 RepID=UPI001CF72B0B|nr:protein windpipe [Tribolium madens]
MKLLVLVASLHLALGASIVDVTCPESCTCQIQDERLETSCDSYEFIKKLIPKQISTIVRLNINNASIINVDSKLKYLKNLNSLDLSRNTITSLPSQFPYLPKLKNLNLSMNYLSRVEFSQLPKNLQVIDLSHNLIENFPKDWTFLKELKTIYFHDNPINCDCDNLSVFEQLRNAGIISENLTCDLPKEFHGRSLDSVNCFLIKENLLNSMLGDEAGSGQDDFEAKEDTPLDEQEEFFKAEGITQTTEDLTEGSGDEGSGDTPILPIEPKACHFNCSTANPIGIHDEINASPAPDLKEGVKIVFEDVLQPEPEPETTTTTKSPVTEEIQIGKEEPTFVKQSDKSEVEMFPTNDTVVGEMERASFENSNTHSVYIVVGLVIALIAFLIVYYVNRKNQKRKNQRKRNKSNENGFGEEMKPLGKSLEAKAPNENNTKLPNETAPLLNGNGKANEDVELRKKDSLSPQPERVTIKASELPDSVPKTPILVHRQINSNGEVVTTTMPLYSN